MRISDWSSDVCSSDLITPGVDLNGTLLTGRGGDPNLDPYRANQYDLSIEWYPDRETIVALAAFYKDIQSYIVNTTSTEILPSVFVPGSAPAGCVAAGGAQIVSASFRERLFSLVLISGVPFSF